MNVIDYKKLAKSELDFIVNGQAETIEKQIELIYLLGDVLVWSTLHDNALAKQGWKKGLPIALEAYRQWKEEQK